MASIVDNKELDYLLSILEGMEDEILAAELLSEFNLASKEQGELILNMEKSLSHDEWKKRCDEASSKVAEIVERIKSHE